MATMPTTTALILSLATLCLVVVPDAVTSARWLTTSQKLASTPELRKFDQLLRANHLAKVAILFRQITILAPTNDAFDKYSARNGRLTVDLVLYHAVLEAVSLGDLQRHDERPGNGIVVRQRRLRPLLGEYPPIWVTYTTDRQVFVNNARVLEESSNYVAKNRADRDGQTQILHVIDEVLYPFSELNVSINTAYNLLENNYVYDLSGYSTSKFLDKIATYRREHLWTSNATDSTYFIPVDQSMTDHQHTSIDSDIINAHVIPGRVLFTKPTTKGDIFETLANDPEYILILLKLEQSINGTMYVTSRTVHGNSNHAPGELSVEIVLGNIPVANGVVHLIRQPLAVFKRKLHKFPYLPVSTKLCNDLTLNITYSLALKTGLFDLLDNPDVQYTLFAPSDKAWKEFAEENAFPLRNLFNKSQESKIRSVLLRHMVVEEEPLGLEELVQRSEYKEKIQGQRVSLALKTVRWKNSNATTRSNGLEITAHHMNGYYYIHWQKTGRMVKVSRDGYECSNGIVHVIDTPLMIYDEVKGLHEPSSTKDALLVLWSVLKKVVF